MSTDSENSGCLNAFYIGLALAGLWFVWKLLQLIYEGLTMLAFGVFEHLDVSYGQMGGAWGYALLGLGLGAAAGAMAAQQRFRLNKLVLVGASVVVMGLLGATLLGDSVESTKLEVTETTATTEIASSAGAEEATTDPPPNAALPAPDTASQPAAGWLRVVVSYAPLRAYWADSTATPLAYLREEDSVRVLRSAHGWARVQRPGSDPATSPTGWIRLAGLGPLLPAAPAEPTENTTNNQPAPTAAADAPDTVTAPTAEQPASEPTAPQWPTGHRQYTGHVGDLNATYSIDWHPNGALSGSYYYDQHPRTIYRLVGTGTATGELRLLEFTRGRQTARCVLQHQNEGYAGTMFNTDGHQFPMTLE